ncbi:MAG: Gfo/Idh/MocA family oxidoreductase [Bryobacteraceae bacterium]|nr:Gfo/Idh/MocA family oxidoreductase [Bryobacteraceae bacterium]
MELNRRTALALSGTAMLQAQQQVKGAIIGAGGRGRYLTGEFKEIGVEMGAVCDIYEANLYAGLKVASSSAKAYTDYRRLLDDKSIQVVVIATPDHWHAKMAIDAVEAGKDVYVEKPMAHTPEEGFRMIEAVRRTRRVLQVGTQRRSFDLFLDAKKVMDSGQVGKVRLVNSWWVNRVTSLRKGELQGKLDWNQWLGTAPKRELSAERFFNWYWFWDYSGGLMVGQAAHIVDAINWFMGSGYPKAVSCTGTMSVIGAEVPETTCLSIEYPDYLAVFVLGYQSMRYSGFNDQMKQFHGDKARFDVARESYALYREDSKATELKPDPYVARPRSFDSATRQHIRNFLDAVKSRKDPSAPVEAGQHTNVALCMAMESLRSGRRVRWNETARRMES